MDFTTMDIATVTRGIAGSGERYLELFLKEYVSLFKEKVNPSCPKCLTEYLNRYKNHFKTMANTSQYRLHAKYENIPLEFGSPILVNNGNITDEYAQKLLEHKNGERYFALMPRFPFSVEVANLKKIYKKAQAKKKAPSEKGTATDTPAKESAV